MKENEGPVEPPCYCDTFVYPEDEWLEYKWRSGAEMMECPAHDVEEPDDE